MSSRLSELTQREVKELAQSCLLGAQSTDEIRSRLLDAGFERGRMSVVDISALVATEAPLLAELIHSFTPVIVVPGPEGLIEVTL